MMGFLVCTSVLVPSTTLSSAPCTQHKQHGAECYTGLRCTSSYIFTPRCFISLWRFFYVGLTVVTGSSFHQAVCRRVEHICPIVNDERVEAKKNPLVVVDGLSKKRSRVRHKSLTLGAKSFVIKISGALSLSF